MHAIDNKNINNSTDNSLMQEGNAQNLQTPVIGRVIAMAQYVRARRQLLPRYMRHIEMASLLKDIQTLYVYAHRELRGKDYLKRAQDLIIEIQAQAYYIHALGGWNIKVAAQIDSMCDEIAEHLYKINNARKARTIKSTDEDG